MRTRELDLLPGTLDVLVLRALRAETETWNDYAAAVARVMVAVPAMAEP
jgi:hypothetical protein